MNCCPKCGDTEKGFSHARYEMWTTGEGTWGVGPGYWFATEEIKPNRYVTCNRCGANVPWKKAYGERKPRPIKRKGARKWKRGKKSD